MTDMISGRTGAGAPLMTPPVGDDPKAQTLGEVLLHLTDDCAEFVAINAFLSKAFTSVMSTTEPQSAELVQGAQHMADLLQTRLRQLKLDLEAAWEKHLSEVAEGGECQ